MTPVPPPPPCPRCSDTHVVRNGATRAGVPSCRACGRRFVAAPRKGPVGEPVERLSLRAVTRITGRARSWLRRFANDLYRRRMPHAPGRLKKSGPLVVEADELWSVVGRKGCVLWVWAALDLEGDRPGR